MEHEERTDDPVNRDGKASLPAPDCIQGPDGRQYLYYFLGRKSLIGVAVCDRPAGKYEFYGHVHYPDGVLLLMRSIFSGGRMLINRC